MKRSFIGADGDIPLGGPISPTSPYHRWRDLTGVRKCRLTLLNGEGSGKSYPVEEPLTLGSSLEAGFTLNDHTVSRYHVELLPQKTGIQLRDLNSTNGTYLGGVRLREALVEDEVTLTVGMTKLRITFDDETQTDFSGLIGQSPAMQQLFGLLKRVAASQSTVLLQGETGTGKEVIARAIHEKSSRSDGPFVVVDCGSVSPTLIESEFFGHIEGAFTGASNNRVGAFLSAQGGTLFLDEIGELPLELQPKLLRVLEAGTVRRVGDDSPKPVDIRIIAATHRDLERECEAGRFRRDLFFRLSVVPLTVPPLRERREDIPVLAEHFARAIEPSAELPVSLLTALTQHTWPGNVRELRNAVGRYLAMTSTQTPSDAAAPEILRSLMSRPNAAEPSAQAISGDTKASDEHHRILDALRRSGGNQTLAARALGISRGTLLSRLDAYGIPRPRKLKGSPE